MTRRRSPRRGSARSLRDADVFCFFRLLEIKSLVLVPGSRILFSFCKIVSGWHGLATMGAVSMRADFLISKQFSWVFDLWKQGFRSFAVYPCLSPCGNCGLAVTGCHTKMWNGTK